MNENPCSHHENIVLLNSLNMGFNLTTLKMSSKLFASRKTESIATQTDLFTGAFVRKNVVHSYDIVTML